MLSLVFYFITVNYTEVYQYTNTFSYVIEANERHDGEIGFNEDWEHLLKSIISPTPGKQPTRRSISIIVPSMRPESAVDELKYTNEELANPLNDVNENGRGYNILFGNRQPAIEYAGLSKHAVLTALDPTLFEDERGTSPCKGKDQCFTGIFTRLKRQNYLNSACLIVEPWAKFSS